MGQFSICTTPERIAHHFLDYCHEWCYHGNGSVRARRATPTVDKEGEPSIRRLSTGCTVTRGSLTEARVTRLLLCSPQNIRYTDGTFRPPPCRRRNDKALRADCAFMTKHVRFTPELIADLKKNRDAVHASTGKLPFDKYLAEAMRHRFCISAPGEWPATPKTAEYVLLGAAGGCLPVVVVKSLSAEALEPVLPFGRWIDWCDVQGRTHGARCPVSPVLRAP